MILAFNQSGNVIFAEISRPGWAEEKGDMVIAVPPQNPKLRVGKRIIGLVRPVCLLSLDVRLERRPSKLDLDVTSRSVFRPCIIVT